MRRPTSAANYSARAAGSCSCSRSRARRNGCCSLTADSSSPRSAPPPERSSRASPTWSPIWRHSPATPSCEEQNVSKYPEVKTADDFHHQPVEYQEAVRKIIRSHALNELYGAQVFDEPAIALAPTPYAKWLTCRVAMEEYHHHVRFKELADQIGVSADEMQPDKKRPLNIFEFPLQTWEEFCAIKMLGDLAEILQVGDLCETREGKARVQDAVNRFYPGAPRFFGSSGSKNNAIFRKYAIKMRKNEEMRDDYMARARDAVDKLGLRLPEVPLAA